MSDGPRKLPPKKEVALALLEQSSLFIHLDPRREGVVVPKWLAGSPQLVLQVGLNMAVQIPDLTVDDDGICCTLSFNRSPVWCNMPWHAVFALRDEEGRRMVWPEDIPSELLQPSSAPAAAAAPAPGRPALSLVKPVEEAPKPAPKRKPRKPKAAPTEEATTTDPAEAAPAVKKRRAAKPKAAPAEEAPAAKPKRARPKAAKPAALKPVALVAPTPELVTAEPSDAKAGSSAKKPKRELPPYLRVVK